VADRILTADGPRGPLFACIIPKARVSTPEVSDRRLTAVLHPYPDEDSAKAALVAAGGKLSEGGAR
jgi:hypothetical protein